jgi:predicted nucleic acid-binding protein
VKWLLDTNVVSESIRPRPTRAITDWIADQAPDLLAISVVTMAELQYGAAITDNEARRHIVTRWLQTVIVPLFGERTIPVTAEILIEWFGMAHRLERRRIARAAPDQLIASTAKVHDLIVVTRNVRDFADTGIVVYDPWNDQTHRMNAP